MASYLFHCILLQLSFGAVLTGPEMLVFSEMSFPLFSNLTIHEHIALFENGNEKSEIIARWETKNATITSEWKRSDYMQKIFIDVLDKTLIIWICNVDQTHSGKYEVIYDINTTGPEVELTIVENKQLDVCLNSPPNSPEKCFGNLTEEQVVHCIEKFLDDHPQYIKRHFGKLTEDEFEKWLDDHPGFMKKYFGNLTAEQIGEEVRKWLADHPEYIKGSLGNLTGEQIQQDVRKWLADHPEYIKEYLEKVMPEQILQMLPCNHPKEVLKESSDSWNPYFLNIVTFIIGMITLLCFLLANGNQIREGLIKMKDWIQKKLCCQPMSRNGSQSQVTSFGMEESELSKEDQVHKWLNDHPDFMDKYLGKLTGDQICKQIQKWQDAYRGLFENKYLVEPDLQLQAQHDTCPISTMAVTDETILEVQSPSKSVEMLLPRNNTLLNDTQSSTSNVEQNTNIKSKKGPEEKLESLDSDSDSNDEQDKLLKDSVDPDL